METRLPCVHSWQLTMWHMSETTWNWEKRGRGDWQGCGVEQIFIDDGEALEALSNVFFSPIQFPSPVTGKGKSKVGRT